MEVEKRFRYGIEKAPSLIRPAMGDILVGQLMAGSSLRIPTFISELLHTSSGSHTTPAQCRLPMSVGKKGAQDLSVGSFPRTLGRNRTKAVHVRQIHRWH